MTTIASQITSLTVVYSTVYSDADQRKHQSSASLAFVWGIHRDRWIPCTIGQLRGKCFHLVTSSCVGWPWHLPHSICKWYAPCSNRQRIHRSLLFAYFMRGLLSSPINIAYNWLVLKVSRLSEEVERCILDLMSISSLGFLDVLCYWIYHFCFYQGGASNIAGMRWD